MVTWQRPKYRGTRSECSGCGLVFSGVKAFDAHRVGPYGLEFAPGRYKVHPDRRCLTEAEMAAWPRTDKGWIRKPLRASTTVPFPA